MFDEKAYSSICFHFCAPKTFKSLKLFKKTLCFKILLGKWGLSKKQLFQKEDTNLYEKKKNETIFA